MLIGAVTAFSLSFAGYPAPVAAIAAVAAGAASSLLFGVLALTLLANQYAAGIALAILGGGLSGFLGRNFGAAPIEPVGPIHVPGLSEVPFIGAGAVRIRPDGVSGARPVRRRLVGAVPHQGGAGHPDHRREPAGRARHRLQGDPDPLRHGRLRRGHGGSRRSLSRARLHSAVGGEHDLGPRLDRARAGRLRELAAASRAAGGAALRGREHPPVSRPEPGDRRSHPSSSPRSPTWRRSWCSCSSRGTAGCRR